MSTLEQCRILAKSDAGRAQLTAQRNHLSDLVDSEREKFEVAQRKVQDMVEAIDKALAEFEA